MVAMVGTDFEGEAATLESVDHIESPVDTAMIDGIDQGSDELAALNVNAPKKATRHRPMSAQEQITRIDEIEQKLKPFGSPTELLPVRKCKKRKASVPELENEHEAWPNLTPLADAREKTEIGNAHDTVVVPGGTVVVPKDTVVVPKPSKRARSWTSSHIPSKTLQLMKMLNQFGSPFERMLSSAIQSAQDELAGRSDTETIVVELQAIARDWIMSNRASLQEIDTLLSRNGIIAFGGVEIPGGVL